MTQGAAAPQGNTTETTRSIRSVIASMEIDTRLLGMVAALGIVWIFFNVISGGNFLTARNLWALSVQSAATAVLATGMVLIIVSRNIDLSVGSIVGLTGYVMAMVQAVWIPTSEGLKLGFDQPYTWVVALAVGIAVGAGVGAIHGWLVAYSRVPSFIVTLGGLLVWRGMVFEIYKGQTISPMDKTFALLGSGPVAAIGEWPSWILGVLACLGIVYTLISGRRRRRRYGFPLRPMWAEATLGIAGSLAVLGFVGVANSYYWPPLLAQQHFGPNASLTLPVGIPNPVLVLLGVTLVMTFVATRRRFGRYVFSIGGNPEAAELGGINTRRTLMMTFVLMGVLSAIAGALYTARLDSGVTSLGTGEELYAIAAAVIGGTSFAGGIGTIPGAVLGAVVFQSLRSGMLLLNVDSPIQDMVVGAVLVGAVGLDAFLQRRSS